jgi:hypothetical protein
MNYRTLKLSFAAPILAASWIMPASAQDLTVTDGSTLVESRRRGHGGGRQRDGVGRSIRQGNNASQSSTDMSPTLRNDAINGKPALRFDGVDDFLEVADSDSVSINGNIATFS